MIHADDRVAPGMGSLFQIRNGLDNLCGTHISVDVIVLIDGKNAEMPWIGSVKIEEVGRILRNDRQAMKGSKLEMQLIVRAHEVCVPRPGNCVSRLPKQVGQQVGIGAIVKIQLEGHVPPCSRTA